MSSDEPSYFQSAIARYRDAGVTTVRIRTANDEHVCAACKTLAGQDWSIDEVPVLPYAKCTCELGCRCSVRPVV